MDGLASGRLSMTRSTSASVTLTRFGIGILRKFRRGSAETAAFFDFPAAAVSQTGTAKSNADRTKKILLFMTKTFPYAHKGAIAK